MPRVNLGRDKVSEKLVALIWGTISAQGFGIHQFSDAIGIKYCTLWARKKKPRDFTVDELLKIGRKLGIPIEDLRNCLTY